ncbi:MAG: ABC transporter permease [Chloroflexi bacterium]|nr:ABC transporter permease [Chloroflexota bacterium]
MGRYLLARTLAAVPTLFLLTFVCFLLTTAARGDPAVEALRQGGQEPTPEAVARFRAERGLDDPLPVRYVRWLGGLAQGDFGRSFLSARTVGDIIGEKLMPTVWLGLSAFAVTSVTGITLGVLFGLAPNSLFDRVGRVITLWLAAIPSFWLALLLVTFISEKGRLLPVAGYGGIQYMILPVIALSCGPAAGLMRITRSAVIEVWRQDYVRTARAKGLVQHRVVLRHTLPNAMLPVVTLLGLRFGQLLAGAVVIESIFSWPGMGTALIQAISGRDLPVIGAYVLIAGVTFVVVNLLTDLSYGLLDPRVRLGGGEGRGGR